MRFAITAMMAALSFGVSQAQAAVTPTFDLVCESHSGQQLRFRFDLSQKRWCVGQCQAVWSIDELSDSTIKLVTYSSDGNNNWTFNINRYTSTFSAIHRGYGDKPADGGQCQALSFSGFPSKKF